jgi:hypothetical protein
MSEPELKVIVEVAPAGAPPFSPSVGERVGDEDAELRQAKPAELCHHIMESGMHCQSPALRNRRFCYSHLRLRGERLRMARAIARRLPYRFDMPALDDLFAVQVAVEHVARALGAGLLERRQAGTLLYALQQSAINHRILALARMNAGSSVDPTLSNPTLAPKSDEKGGAPVAPADMQGGALGDRVGQQARLVEEYPGFEAEYGLAAGLDVSQPAQLVFPPPEQVWQVVPAPPMVARPNRKRWTKEAIELEELHKRREQLGPYDFNDQVHQIQNRISNHANAEFRKRQEAAWQAEADRRNTAEEAKDQEYASMDEPQRRAFHLGVLRGLEAAQEQAEEEAQKKPAAKAAVGS